MTLLEWRKQQKMTQEGLAKLLKTDRALVCKWERGEHSPTAKTIMKIMEVTKGAVTLADIVRTSERG